MASVWMGFFFIIKSSTHGMMTQKLLYFYLPNSTSQKLGLSQPNASKMSCRMYTYSREITIVYSRLVLGQYQLVPGTFRDLVFYFN